MSTLTSRLLLTMPATTENYDIAVANGNMTLIDGAVGIIFCTSGTRPSVPFANMQIYETDTGNRLGRNTANTAWIPQSPYRVADATARTALGAMVEGFLIYRVDRDWFEFYDGAAWRVRGIAICASAADQIAAITSPYDGQFSYTIDTLTLWVRQAGIWEAYPNKPTFMLRQTIAQSFTNSTFAPITFDVEDNDSNSGHSTVSNTDRYTCPLAGLWELGGGASSAVNSTGSRIPRLTKNGAIIAGSAANVMAPTDGNFAIVGARTVRVQLALNDIIRLEYAQVSGGSLNTAVTDYAQPTLTGRWIRP